MGAPLLAGTIFKNLRRCQKAFQGNNPSHSGFFPLRFYIPALTMSSIGFAPKMGQKE
jgi:hypothetical protein